MTRVTREGLDKAISEAERERREESSTRRLLKNAQKTIGHLEAQVDLLTTLDGIEVTPAEWAQPKSEHKEHHAIANLLVSDLHLDEVVDPAAMRYANAYNRDIALRRLQKLAEKTIIMARDYISGVKYDGIFVYMNGDLISGNIHEELQRTNDGYGIADSMDYWVDPIAGFLDHLASYFGNVHVVSTVGNHGREFKKPPSKGAVKSSFDWLMMRGIWRQHRTDDRFTWNIPESKNVLVDCYSSKFLVQHGDDFKGGDQIAGALRPILMGDFRSMAQEVSSPTGEPYDKLIVSHFHQYHDIPRVVLNGSVVGWNEYAKDKLKARWEPAQQAFWIVTPELGPTMHFPVIVQESAEKEGWA